MDTDREFSAVLLARDLAERFRAVDSTGFFLSAGEAWLELENLAAEIETRLDDERIQGDEGSVTDFFSPVVEEEKLHARFRTLLSDEGYKAARSLISNLMHWYGNRDGNFVEQFQTGGFDARVWELYVFAAFMEAGYKVTQPKPSPDFLVEGLLGSFFIEATTVNPSMVGPDPVPSQKPESSDDVPEYVYNYLPIRFAGPLCAKLQKRYWTNPDVAGKPLVIAIQDFHDEMSMVYSGLSLVGYLDGVNVSEVEQDGVTETVTRPVLEHVWGNKRINSGFFRLPEAENISAVIFNAAGTLSKFNRIGTKVGFGSPSTKLTHFGRKMSPDCTREESFSEEVAEGYRETWVDGMEVFHNPNAAVPLDPDCIPGARHHFQTDQGFIARTPPGYLVSSKTLIINTY